MFISQRGSGERDEGRGQEEELRRRSRTGCDSFGPSAHQIVWWAKNAHGSESVWELSSDKGGSYACYSPIRPVSHTRAGGEEKGRAKDFHTKGNKQVHLLATNQSGGSCANINKKGEKINKWGIYCAALRQRGEKKLDTNIWIHRHKTCAKQTQQKIKMRLNWHIWQNHGPIQSSKLHEQTLSWFWVSVFPFATFIHSVQVFVHTRSNSAVTSDPATLTCLPFLPVELPDLLFLPTRLLTCSLIPFSESRDLQCFLPESFGIRRKRTHKPSN